MKIELTDNTKMHTALSLAGKNRYYDALCLFAQVDSYESLINQIVCLCVIGDNAYAADCYRFLKQKYGETHAVYADVRDFDDVVEVVLNYCEPGKSYARNHDGKIRADKSLLIKLESLPESEEFSAPDLNYEGDYPLMEDPLLASNRFFDVKSPQYFDSLRVNMERCLMEGDEKMAEQYAQRILDLETDHLPTLEAQISLVLFLDNYKDGIVYAERLAKTSGGSHAAVGGAIEILVRTNPTNHLETLKILMFKALDIIDDITLYDLEDYIYIATTYLYDLEMAFKFAKALFSDYKNASLEALKMCACAFFNFGEANLAKDAAISLLRAVPRDAYAQALVDFFKMNPYSKNQAPMDVPPRVLRHFCMPSKLFVHANREICKLLDVDSEQMRLGKRELFYLSVLMLHCKSLILSNQHKGYYQLQSFIRAVICTVQPENPEEYLQFLKANLLTTMNDQCLVESILSHLVSSGFLGKVFVSLQDSYYLLDLSRLERQDNLFCRAFALCASLVKINSPEKYTLAYKKIRDTLEIDEEETNIERKMAFAMLSLCVSRFSKTQEWEFFDAIDAELYKDFVTANKLQKNIQN